jgi:putative ABC transport system permease protein
MLELVLANLKVRPFRTIISVIGVALGVVLVVLFTGLARGMTEDMSRRAYNVSAEIIFSRPGAVELTSSNASVSTTYAERLMQIEGVAATVPMIQYITPNPNQRWGIQRLDGVDWESFARMNNISIAEGRAPQTASGAQSKNSDSNFSQTVGEVVVDERYLSDEKLKIGDQIELFGTKKYQITGVFAPPSGARIKMSLAAMQDALEAPNKCTYILVKLKNGADADQVAARINQELPGNEVNLTRDLVIDAQDRIPALNTFLRALVGLGAFVSTVFVLLSMYTTITERRKEIGILKSLGAPKSFIIKVIEGEALMIGILGVALGFAVSLAASFLIAKSFDLQFEFSRSWMITAVVIAVGGSLFGALYPAWRASAIDPVEVMANE